MREVLLAYMLHRQDVGYCQARPPPRARVVDAPASLPLRRSQGMSFLVALMLGHMGKEEAFWLLVSIVEELPEDFYKNTALTECEILQVCARAARVRSGVRSCRPCSSAPTAQGLVAERLPALRDHLGPQFPLAVNFLAVRWFITFFVHETPLETTLAVWDVFFGDGLVAVYRCAAEGAAFMSSPRNPSPRLPPSSSPAAERP